MGTIEKIIRDQIVLLKGHCREMFDPKYVGSIETIFKIALVCELLL
jgi:hypothetical protein